MRAKPFIIGFLAIVAVLAAVSIYLSATVDRADKSVAALVSPDGKFKAVTISFAGHGATPFCVVSISVMLAVYPDEFAQQRKEYEVFSAPCGTFANGGRSPKIGWVSDTNLQITRATAPDTKAARSTKNIDVTKSVHVTVVERD